MADDESSSLAAPGTPQHPEAQAPAWAPASLRELFGLRAPVAAQAPVQVQAPSQAPAPAPASTPASTSTDTSAAASLLMQLRALEEELEDLPLPATLDQASARAAGFRIRSAGALTVIKGLGPQAEKMLKSAGIRSLQELARHPDSQLLRMFQLASPRLRRIRPNQWQAQARLAAANLWPELQRLQDSLRKTQRR